MLPVLLPHCNVSTEHFCGLCRDKDRGQVFREGVLHRNGIDCEIDFECPKGKQWGVAKTKGPGDHLHDLFAAKYGLKPCQRCLEVINEMNTLGVEGCREHKDRIVQDIWQRRDQLKGWKRAAAEIAGKWEIGRLFDEALVRASC